MRPPARRAGRKPGDGTVEHELIVAIVERGKAQGVVKAAVKAGAPGATIIYGRGTGEHVLSFFQSLKVEPAKEIILLLVALEARPAIFAAVAEAARVREGGKGIAFVLPVSALVGIGRAPADDSGL